MTGPTAGHVLWSKGPGAADGCPYALAQTEATSDEAALVAYISKSTGTLWVRTGSRDASTRSDLDVVAENLAVLRFPVTLVTSDGDRAVPSSYPARTVRAILDSPMVERWLTQNYDGSVRHAKLRAVPIGLDLHTAQWAVRGPKAAFIEACRATKRQRVLCDAHLTPSHPERGAMLAVLGANASIDFLREKVPFADLMRMYGEYQFVLSPRGNGLDCHRTWEALLAGCIVITRTSALDGMYAEHRLPVVVVGDWAELNSGLPAKLAAWASEHARGTARERVRPKLEFGYWLSPALVVGGTARDCARFLPSAFERLDALAKGRRVYYVFYESNSSDATLEMLRAFVAGREGEVVTERTGGERTERIARGRNAIVQRVEALGAFDFFVNVDMDDRCQFEVESVRACLARASEWDVATANQTGEYYDRWALRTDARGDMYEGNPHCVVGYGHTAAAGSKACDPSMILPISAWFPGAGLEGKATFPRTAPYYAVHSAFGGLAIYKTRLLRGARYAPTKPGPGRVPECEHVTFHAAIRAQFPGTRIVVAPYLISGP
jgi:hypothetical protein